MNQTDLDIMLGFEYFHSAIWSYHSIWVLLNQDSFSLLNILL